MTPHQFTWQVVQTYLSSVDGNWKTAAGNAGVSENTLRYSVEDGTAKDKTLLQIVENLGGIAKSYEFLLEYRGQLNGLDAEVSNAVYNVGKTYEGPRVRLKAREREVLMHANTTYGIARERLYHLFPGRKDVIDMFIARGILKQKNHRLISADASNSPDVAVADIDQLLEII